MKKCQKLVKSLSALLFACSMANVSMAQWTNTGPAFNKPLYTAGNVSIGNVTNPSYKLTLGGGVGNTRLALYDNSAYDATDVYGFGIQSYQLRFHLNGSPSARFSFLSDAAGTSELVTIQSTGNVGIGTTSPSEKLTVGGNAKITGILAVAGNSNISGSLAIGGTANVSGAMSVSGNSSVMGNQFINGNANINGTLYVGQQFQGGGKNLSFDSKGVFEAVSRSNGNDYNFQFNTITLTSYKGPALKSNYNSIAVSASTGPVVLATGGVEYFRVNGNGNVGIGTSNPASKLTIDGNVQIGATFLNASGKGPKLQFSDATDNTDITYIQRVNTASDATSLRVVLGDNTDKNDLFEVGYQDATGNFFRSAVISSSGTLSAKEVCTNPTATWCDYVFENDYKLAPLTEVEAYIKANKHLSEIPAAAVIEKNGIKTGEMLTLHMKKIEELTLYLIEMNKEMAAVKSELARVKSLSTSNK